MIDYQTAIRNLGLPDLFYMMLGQFEDMMLTEHMQLLAVHMVNKSWLDMKIAAHNIKGSSGYIGVSRLHYACYYV